MCVGRASQAPFAGWPQPDADNAVSRPRLGVFSPWHLDNSTYLASGACSGLPGFTGSGGVVCNTTGNATSFSVTTHHPSMSYTTGCTWTSNPASGTPNLVCS